MIEEMSQRAKEKQTESDNRSTLFSSFFALRILRCYCMCRPVCVNYIHNDTQIMLTHSSRTANTISTYTRTHTHALQTSRALISLSLLLTVTVPLLRRVSGCADWKQEAVTQHKVLSIKITVKLNVEPV